MADGKGIIGQLTGPFESTDNIITIIQNKEDIDTSIFFKLGISISEKYYMVYTQETVNEGHVSVDGRFNFIITFGNELTGSGTEFWLGKTQIYESDEGLYIKELIFPQGAPASTLIEYTILSRD